MCIGYVQKPLAIQEEFLPVDLVIGSGAVLSRAECVYGARERLSRGSKSKSRGQK